MSQRIERIFGRIEIDDPINFSPSNPATRLQGQVDGIEAEDLGSLAEDYKLKLPASFHLDPFVPIN
jgi:hypothetical protein